MITVLTAVGPQLEAQAAVRVEAASGARLVRRCADVPDLLSAAAAHIAQVAVLSADLPGLDRGVLGTLADDGLRTVGVHAAGDEEAQRRLRQLGVDRVISAQATAAEWSELVAGLSGSDHDATTPDDGDGTVEEAIERELLGRDGASGAQGEARPTGDPADADGADAHGDASESADAEPAEPADPDRTTRSPRSRRSRRSGPSRAEPGEETQDEADADRRSTPARVVAVWGPAGSPGRTTVAVNLAAELARLGRSVLLVDADTYGASVGQALALLDEAPGLAAATRLADTGDLDLPHLAAVAPTGPAGVRVLTGLPRADRWSEIREDALREVLRVARLLVDVVVVDTGFCLEEDEELSYDTRAPRRNVATTTSLREADDILVVGSADPVGLQRLVRGLDEIGAFTAAPRVVVTKVRASAVGAGPDKRVTETLQRFAGVESPTLVPDDRNALDAAMLEGRALCEAAPGSGARRALATLAGEVAGVEVVLRRRGLTRRRRTSAATA